MVFRKQAPLYLMCMALALALALGCGCGKREAPKAPPQAGDKFFDVTQADGVWWFVGPDKERFVSLGINHIEPALISSKNNKHLFMEKYGDDLILPTGRANPKSKAASLWMKESMALIRSWGFNTLGVHNPISQNEMPYVARFRPAKIDGWQPGKKQYKDPFSPKTREHVDAYARRWAEKNRNDPLILGVSFNDMPVFHTPPGAVHPWVMHIMELGPWAPGKARFMEMLKSRYANPAEAAAAYGINADTWEGIKKQKQWPAPGDPGRVHQDSLVFLPQILDAWYGLLVESLKKYDARHLIFGDKLEGARDMPTWLDPILKKHFDVIYIQWYDTAENQVPRLSEMHRNTAKPILLGDSSFSCPNENNPHPKGVHLSSQKAVGEAYRHYLETVMKQPYILGWHFCGFIEGSPDLKELHPFYAIQSGFLRPDGAPYEETISFVKEANPMAAQWHEAVTPEKAGSADTTSPKVAAPQEPATPPGETKGNADPLCTTEKRENFTLSRVGEKVYNIGQFHVKNVNAPFKNISWVVTDEGVVVIDTGYVQTARAAKRAIAATTKQPIRFIIYTHHHGTQVGGAAVLKGPRTEIIAHEDLVLEFDRLMESMPFNRRLNSIQFDKDQGPFNDVRRPVYPDITYKSDYSFTLGGTRFELFHAVGEAYDYTIVFLPKEKVVFTADLVGVGAPMVGSPMKPVRDDVKWKLALQFIGSLDPSVLVDSVKPPICNKEEIRKLLDARIRYLDFLHKAVIAEINAGSTEEQAARRIELPEDLKNNPLVQDQYGSLAFNVRGLFQRYTGWFDQNGTHLNPTPANQRAASFIKAMGGAEKVLPRALELKKSGQLQLALEYLDLLIEAGDQAAQAHEMKSQILQTLAEKSTHRITRQMYRRLAKMEKGKAGAKP